MSTTIDERVVSMKFDNKDFEKNVAQTIDTLEKLDKQLDFKDAEKNFKKIEDASKEVTLSGLTKSAEAVKVEFSAMSIVAITAISKIVDTAMDAGAKIVKQLSIDQVTAGFAKYESKLNSVQAIMNTTGKSIEEVELQMRRLMTYTDETSYSFTDMVANIGTFTSNRIDLDTATKSMMGIANAAGFAGVNSEKATHAMQGFSKAMGQGFMDRSAFTWLKTSSMAIPELKEQFIEAAVAAGTLVKTSEGLYKTLEGNTVSVEDFETALKDKWLTSGVLNTALGKFGAYSEALMQIMDETKLSASDAMDVLDEYIKTSGDETLAYSAKMFKAAQAYRTFGDAIAATRDAVSTGWMETFDIIFGNLEEARDLWATVGDLLYDVFAQPIKDRNKMLSEWKELGGRDDILDAFFTSVDNATEVVGALKKALDSVFPPMTAQRLKDMTTRFKEFVSYFKFSEPALYSLQVIVQTLLVPFRVLFELFKVGISVVSGLTKIVFTLVNAFLELSALGNPITMLLEKIFGAERYAKLAKSVTTIKDKILEAFRAVSDKIKSVFNAETMTDVFAKVFSTVWRVLEPIVDLLLDGIVWGFDKLANMDFSSIQGFMSDMLKFFGSIGGGIIALFTTGFGNAAEALKEFKGFSLKSWFATFKTDVKSVTGEVTGLSKAFSEEGIIKNITNAASVVSGKLANIGSAIGDLVGQISPAGIIVSGLGLTFIELSHNISLAIGSFAKVGTSLAGMLDGIKGVFTNISTVVKTFGETLKGKIQVEKFKALTLAIIAFAGALVVLSFVQKHNQNLLEVVGVIGILLAEMAAFFGIMAAINKFGAVGSGAVTSIKQFALTLAAMGGALLLLASAIKIISGVDVTHIWQQLSVLTAAMIGMVISLRALAQNDKQITEGSLVIIAFALALKSIAKTFVTLSKANFDNVPGTLAMLAGILGAMFVLSKMAKGISWSGGAGMFAMVVSILALTGVLSILAAVDVGALIVGIGKYILLFGVMLTLALAAKAATKALGSAGSVGGLAAMFLSMAAAVAVLSLAIKTVGSLSLQQAIQGTVAVSVILGMFALIMQASKRGILDGENAKQSFAGMAVAILALTLAIDYLGGLDTAKLLKGTAAVAALMGMFAVLQMLEAKNKSITGSAVFIGVTIAALVGALAVLQLFDFGSLMKATIALGAILVAFGQTLKYIGNVTGKKGSVLAMIEVVVLITSFTTALYTLARQDWQSLLSASLGLSAVMLAFGALTKMVGNMETDFIKTLKSLVQFALVITALMGITTGMIALLNMIPAERGLVEKVIAFGLVLSAVAGVAVVLSNTNPEIAKVAKGLASVLIVMGAVAAVAAILWAVCSSTDWTNVSTNSDAIIASLTMAIVLVGVCAALGFALGAVGKAFNPAAVAIGVADILVVLAGVLAVVAVLGAVMAALGALESAFGISNFLSSGGKIFVDLLTNIGAAIGGFLGGIIGGIGYGIVQGAQLDEVAGILTNFVNAFADIPEDNINKCISVVQSIANLFAAMPETGFSLKSFIFGGQKTLDKVFDGLDGFIAGIQSMTEQIGDGSSINLDGIQKSVDAASIISEFENSLPKTGGVVQAWFGEGNLGQFSENMASFGNALWRYYVNTKSIANWSLFEQGKVAGGFINDLNKNLPATGGALQFLLGQQDLGKFAENMASFGGALTSFANSVSTVTNWDVFKNGEVAGKAISNVAKSVSEIDYGFLSGNMTLKEFGIQLSSLGSFMNQYNENISSINWNTFSAATDNLGALVKVMDGTSKVGTDTTVSFMQTLSSLAKAGISSFANAFSDRSAVMTVDDAASKLITTITSSLNTHSTTADYMTIGKQAVAGMAKGIDSNVSSLKTSGKKAADVLCESLEKTLEINSPSKRTYKIGQFCILGLEKGLLENQSITNKAASQVANNVLKSMKDTLEIHSPSYRVRQEVARPVLEAFPEEFDTNNEAEKAAKAKGEAILSAFKSAFEDSSEARELLDLEKQLFELKLSPDLSDAEKQKAIDDYNTEYQRKQLQTYVDDYKLSVQQYQTIVRELGEESTMAQEAQRTMLQKEISLRQYAANMITVTSEDIQNATQQSIQNWQDYYDWMKSSQFKALLKEEFKDQVRLGNVSLLDESDPKVLQMNAQERIKAELDALEQEVKQEDWEKKYADILKPLRSDLFNRYMYMYIDEDIEKLRYAKPDNVDDILLNAFDGITIDQYAAQDVAGELSDSFLKALEESLKEAEEKTMSTTSSAGSKAASSYTSGFSNTMVNTGTEEMTKAMEEAMTGVFGRGGDDGDLLSGFMPDANSLASVFDNATSSFTNWISNLGSKASEMVANGANTIAGYVTGMNSQKEEVEKVSLEIAKLPKNTTERFLDINSPSKVMYQLGVYTVQGFINALRASYSNVANASAGVANIVADTPIAFADPMLNVGQAATLAEEINDTVESTEPVITPVLDLTQVHDQLRSLSSEISSRMAARVSSTTRTPAVNQNGSPDAAKTGSSVTFNQYNTSPKALDPIEIYRQTRNQLSILKEGLKKDD